MVFIRLWGKDDFVYVYVILYRINLKTGSDCDCIPWLQGHVSLGSVSIGNAADIDTIRGQQDSNFNF